MAQIESEAPYRAPRSQPQERPTPGDGPPRVWPVYTLFLVALLITSVVTWVLIGATFSAMNPGAQATHSAIMKHALSPPIFTGTIFTSAIVLLSCSLGAGLLSPVPLDQRLGLAKGRMRPLAVVLAMVGLPALSMVIETVTLLLGVEIDGTLEMIGDSIASARGIWTVLIVVTISLGPGLGEELLFRGYIQTRLVERHGPAVAIIVASLLFGLMHMDPLQSTLTAFMGVYLGFLAYRFGSLWPAVLAHALNNGVSALALTLFPDEADAAEPNLIGLVVGAVVFSGCLAYVLKNVPAARRGDAASA